MTIDTLFQWFQAAQTGDIEAITSNTTRFAEKLNTFGQTALQIAVLSCHIDLVKYLIPFEAKLLSSRSETALYLAIKHRNIRAVELLAEHEFDILSCQILPIFQCLQENFQEAILVIAPYCTARETFINVHGQTVFTQAIIDQNLQFLTILGPQFANELDEYQHHPLITAIKAANKPLIQCVFDNTDFTVFDQILISCYQLGIVLNTEILIEKLAKNRTKFGSTALIELAKQNKKQYFSDQELAILEQLVMKEVTLVDEYKQTALMHAAKSGKLNLMSILVEKEATFQCKFGHTAMIKAVINQQIESVKFLMEWEAGIVDFSGNTALKFAVELNLEDIVVILQNEVQNFENGPVQRAVIKGNQKVVKRLQFGVSQLGSDQKSDMFELASSKNVMRTIRDFMSSGDDFEVVKSRVLDRHCGWDQM